MTTKIKKIDNNLPCVDKMHHFVGAFIEFRRLFASGNISIVYMLIDFLCLISLGSNRLTSSITAALRLPTWEWRSDKSKRRSQVDNYRKLIVLKMGIFEPMFTL